MGVLLSRSHLEDGRRGGGPGNRLDFVKAYLETKGSVSEKNGGSTARKGGVLETKGGRTPRKGGVLGTKGGPRKGGVLGTKGGSTARKGGVLGTNGIFSKAHRDFRQPWRAGLQPRGD